MYANSFKIITTLYCTSLSLSLSLAVAYFVLGKRLGALNLDNVPEDCQEFISSMQEFFAATQELLFSTPFKKFFPTKAWRSLEETQIKIYELSLNYISNRIGEIKEREEEGKEETSDKRGDFMTYMIENSGLTLEQISVNAQDLLGAGVDTVCVNALLMSVLYTYMHLDIIHSGLVPILSWD